MSRVSSQRRRRRLLISAMGGGQGALGPPVLSGDVAPEVGDVDESTVVVTFSRAINSPALGYDAGVAIDNGGAVGIDSATRQTNHAIVYYAIDTPVDLPDTPTWAYTAASGDLEGEGDSIAMDDIAATPVTNYVGSHAYFDRASDSGHVASVL
jgi:hypothetical protein